MSEHFFINNTLNYSKKCNFKNVSYSSQEKKNKIETHDQYCLSLCLTLWWLYSKYSCTKVLTAKSLRT